MNEIKNFNLGNFIKIEHISKAYDLIKLQIEDDTFSFKTIELEIYRLEEKLTTFKAEQYFENYIAKDNFYNHNQTFFNLEYLIPKGMYGVRKFNFLSFELLILYYSLGFYIYSLIKKSYDVIEVKKKAKTNIFTYYGGTINFEMPKNSDLYYLSDYIEFNNIVNGKIEEIIDFKKKAIIIKLDIQDYFKSIDVEILLDIISKYTLPSNTKKYNFDSSTIEEIKNLFIFMNKGLVGLPLFSQNIVSNFLSYIYLFELDNYIQKMKISKSNNFLYCRYVDDFFIIYSKDRKVKNETIGNEIFDITTNITEFLFENLKLSTNPLKTQTLIIENTDDLETFIKKEKIISIPESLKKDKTPKEKLKDAVNIIENLQDEYQKKGRAYLTIEDNNKLKSIFSGKVKEYIKSKEAVILLDKLFKDWNSVLTLTNSQVLIFLLKHSKYNELLKAFLLSDTNSKLDNPQYLNLLEKYILSNKSDTDFNKKVLNTNIENSYFLLIRKLLDKNIVLINRENIFLDDLFLNENDTVMQQLKMLVLAEMESKFNLAFNHLLNLYHYYCFKNDKSKTEHLKDYTQPNVIDFLDDLELPIEYINFTIHFFDRRNKNNISHPGDKLMESWIVNGDEYFKFKKELNKLLIDIKASLPPPVVSKPF